MGFLLVGNWCSKIGSEFSVSNRGLHWLALWNPIVRPRTPFCLEMGSVHCCGAI